MLLEGAGHEVISVGDGRAGVVAARNERPDLVVMDLSLPLVSGWEATREIKADPKSASIPVLAVTATGTVSSAGMTMVSGPGQKASAKTS